MILLIGFAFLAGIVTILSPCILPLLPIILSGSVGEGKARPWGIISGFVLSFTFFTLALSALVKIFAPSANILRWMAGAFILLFGLIMVIPGLKNRFMQFATKITSRFSGNTNLQKSGYLSGLLLGLSLGLVWTPCVGPIMASVISLALSQSVDAGSVFITMAYALGTAIPMILIMFGGKALLNKNRFLSRYNKQIQMIFGVLMIATSLALFTGFDRSFQTWVLDAFPKYGSGLTALEEADIVKEAIANRRGDQQSENVNLTLSEKMALYDGEWLNSTMLSAEDLKGKVILVDFWTYSCINCIRTLPYLRSWYESYNDDGLIIIGVHSPEFAFEQSIQNLSKAVTDLGVTWPVVQDNSFAIWNAFENQFWPAHYLFNRDGNLVYTHFGEGKYEETEMKIQELLNVQENLASKEIEPTLSTTVGLSPETYLGYSRARGFASVEDPDINTIASYSIPSQINKNNWALAGEWNIESQSSSTRGNGILIYNFHAKNIYLVISPLESEKSGSIHVQVDGKKVNTIDVKEGILQPDTNRLYHLFTSPEPVSGIIQLDFDGAYAVYAFTFG